MKISLNAMMRDFHSRLGSRVCAVPTNGWGLHPDDWAVRDRLIREEAREVLEAFMSWATQPEDLAKEFADLIYVVAGTAYACGIDIDAVLAEVHRSNMSKGTAGQPVFDQYGKALKGDDYIPPDLGAVLRAQH